MSEVPAPGRRLLDSGRRWRLGSLFAASAVLTLGEGSLLVLVGPYLDEVSLPEGMIGLVMVWYGVGALISRFWSGAIYRTSRAPKMIGLSCGAMALAYLALPLVSHPIGLAALLMLNGAGYAVATTSGFAAVADRHPVNGNAGSVMGWYTGATGAGYALAGFLAGPLADEVGIRPALMMVAVLPALAGVLLAWILRRSRGDTRPTGADEPRTALQAFRRAPSPVWVSFFVAFYISLVNGGLFTFFPIHALAIGLTLTQVGVMAGVHGTTAAGIRFLSGPIFRFVDYRRVLPVAVVINGLALMSVSASGSFLLLTGAWGLIGLTRGVLRVASGALVIDSADESDRGRGVASTIYLAGLDVGKILGPLLTGITAEVLGLPPTFAVIGAVFVAIYFIGTRRIDRKTASAET
ncbi:MAG TPA: MFS transporter [Acidimicrobiia bacterium]|nr:MFS transporter [Acidimicrobiia bacterium]